MNSFKVIPVIEAPTIMVQSACKPSDSEGEVSEEEVEEVNEETTEEVVVVTKEEIQDSKLSNSESPVMVENEESTEAKDRSMKLEDLQGEDEAVVFEMEPANVSMGNVSMEQIDVTEESFEQASDSVVLTPTEKAENEVESEEKGEEITEDWNEEIETAANQVIADSIEGAISEVTNLNESEFVEETEDGAAADGARKCEDAAPDVVACQSPPPDFVIPDNQGTEGDQNDVEEATINEEVSAPNKCDDAGPDVIACQSPPADFVAPDDEIKLDIPIIEAPAIMVCSSYQQSDSEESEDEQTEEVKDIAEDIAVDDGEEVTAAKKCENAAPEVIACQSPPADFNIPVAKAEESEKIEAEEVAPIENNEERSTSVIENATDSPTEDTKTEGQTEIKTSESNAVTKDCPKPTQQKYISRDETSLKLLTGQAMNLALSYATFIIKDTNLQHNLENYRVSNGPSTGGTGSTAIETKAAEKTEENIPEKKPESESEEEDDFGFDLFG